MANFDAKNMLEILQMFKSIWIYINFKNGCMFRDIMYIMFLIRPLDKSSRGCNVKSIFFFINKNLCCIQKNRLNETVEHPSSESRGVQVALLNSPSQPRFLAHHEPIVDVRRPMSTIYALKKSNAP